MKKKFYFWNMIRERRVKFNGKKRNRFQSFIVYCNINKLKPKPMKLTEENLDRVVKIVKEHIADENNKGEFDEETGVVHAVKTVVEWIEEKEKDKNQTQ